MRSRHPKECHLCLLFGLHILMATSAQQVALEAFCSKVMGSSCLESE